MNTLDPQSKAVRVEQIKKILPSLTGANLTKLKRMIELCIERLLT